MLLFVPVGLPSASIEHIKESIIHKIGELLENGVDSSNIYLLSNITNVGRYFIKYPDYMLDSLTKSYKDGSKIGKYIASSLVLTGADEYKSKEVKAWEKNIISNIENSRLPIQNFEIYLESIVILQSFLKRNNISHTLFPMNNIFEGWSNNFNHVYSNFKGPIVPDLSKTLHIKENLPNKISILRLDTDFYESTKAELEVLFPLLVKDGFLIIDDYRHWQGCQRAVDEYFSKEFVESRFERLDYTGIMYKKA
jgi:hypothetical protein